MDGSQKFLRVKSPNHLRVIYDPKIKFPQVEKKILIVNLGSKKNITYSLFLWGVEKWSFLELQVCDYGFISLKSKDCQIWIFAQYKSLLLYQIKCILTRYTLPFSLEGRKTVIWWVTSVSLLLVFVSFQRLLCKVKFEFLSSTKVDHYIKSSIYWLDIHSLFRWGVEKRSFIELPVCHCGLMPRKLKKPSVRSNLNFCPVQKLIIISNQVYID